MNPVDVETEGRTVRLTTGGYPGDEAYGHQVATNLSRATVEGLVDGANAITKVLQEGGSMLGAEIARQAVITELNRRYKPGEGRRR